MKIKLCYFNGHWNIYIYSKDNTSWQHQEPTLQAKPVKKVYPTNPDGEFKLRTYRHPEIPTLCNFGVLYNEHKFRPGHNGEWSSNSSSINQAFGTHLYEVAVDQISMAVPLPWLKEILGDRVKWSPNDIYEEWITEVVGENNTWEKWVTIVETT